MIIITQQRLGSSIKVFVRAVSIKPQELAVPLPFSESFEVIFGKGGQRSLAFSFGILLFST